MTKSEGHVCNCPAASEQMRYGEFTVLVPACRWPEVEAMSGDGRYLIVTEHAAPRASYRLDLQTNQRQLIWRYGPAWGNGPDISDFWFLTNDLLLTIGKGQSYALIDVHTGKQRPVPWQYPDQLSAPIIQTLQQADQIILADTAAVVLAPDPFDQHSQNVVLYSASPNPSKLQDRLHAVSVTPLVIRPERPFGTKAGTARTAPLWVDQYGISTAYVPAGDTAKVLLRRTGFTRAPGSFRGYSARGWTANDQGVVYASSIRYVLENIIDFFGTVSLLPVPQPVLLLHAPPVPPGGE